MCVKGLCEIHPENKFKFDFQNEILKLMMKKETFLSELLNKPLNSLNEYYLKVVSVVWEM